MATTYKFKTEEDIDAKSRTIIKTIPVPVVPETTKEESFTMENKEKDLANAKEALVVAQVKVDELEAEILEVKIALEIK